MPNWCFNRVVFTGTEADCAAFRELMGAERGAFDFNAVVPLPPELERCNYPDATAAQLKYGDWETLPWWGAENYPSREAALQAARHPENAERWFSGLHHGTSGTDLVGVVGEPRTFDDAADMAHTNTLVHGHPFWYGWCCEHWGTKWSVPAGEAKWSSEPGRVVVEFDTAWAPPGPVFDKVAERFPDANMAVEYDSLESGFHGRMAFARGVELEREHQKYTEEEYRRIFGK